MSSYRVDELIVMIHILGLRLGLKYINEYFNSILFRAGAFHTFNFIIKNSKGISVKVEGKNKRA